MKAVAVIFGGLIGINPRVEAPMIPAHQSFLYISACTP